MYEYFEGVITVVTPSYVVVDVGGVGYKVYSPTPFPEQASLWLSRSGSPYRRRQRP